MIPIRLRCAYCARTLALRTAEGSMALLDLAVMGDWLWRGEPLVIEAVGKRKNWGHSQGMKENKGTKATHKNLLLVNYRIITS